MAANERNARGVSLPAQIRSSADADSLSRVLIAGAQTSRVRTQLSWSGWRRLLSVTRANLVHQGRASHAKMLDHCVRDPPILCRGVLRAPDDQVLPGNGSRPTGKWRAKLVAKATEHSRWTREACPCHVGFVVLFMSASRRRSDGGVP